MTTKAGAIALAFLLPVAGIADPARDAALCLQNQLVAMGEDPGPVDGVVGARTRAAAGRVREAAPDETLAALPLPDRFSAVTWCRTLALTDNELDAHRPGAAPPRIAVAGSVGQALVESAFDRVAAHFRDTYALVPVARYDIAVAADIDALVRQARDLPSDTSRRRQALRDWAGDGCGTGPGVTGVTFIDAMYFCWPPRTVSEETWTRMMRGHLEYVMAHEMMHVLQAELAELVAPLPARIAGESNLGPNWLVEGAALVISDRYINPGWMESDGALGARQAWVMSLPGDAALGTLRGHGSVSRDAAYPLAGLAVHVLVERHGTEALFDYWRRVGQTGDTVQAFEDTFGIGLAAFEPAFEAQRGTPGGLSGILAGKADG